MTMSTTKKLDKFYTKPEVAFECYNIFLDFIPSNILIVEPSAGDGSFLKIIQNPKLGFDLLPENEKIIQNDFLNDKHIKNIKETFVILGNPPFGKKSQLAIDFLNKSLDLCDTVGFIVPNQFRKWSVQKQIKPTAKLVLDHDLREDAFLFNNKSYNVRCCFQIWKNDSDFCERIKIEPDLRHFDFEMYQYNCTDQAKKFFDYDWDFAVPRQGFLDYTIKVFSKNDLTEHQQWIFFKARNKTVLDRLLKLDFETLSKKNIGIPGFGKADVIAEYDKLYDIDFLN